MHVLPAGESLPRPIFAKATRSQHPPALGEEKTAQLTPPLVLRRQRNRILQHNHTLTSRIPTKSGTARLPRLRRHQFRLRIAGLLDD
jgi:hypothetical protein